jgi:hypothetical protein
MIMNVRVMRILVRNVSEMHVWAEMLGQGIIWQGTSGQCTQGQGQGILR